MSCNLRYLPWEKIIEKFRIESGVFVISLILRNKTKRRHMINLSTESNINRKE